MFFREALQKFAQLETEMAELYGALAALPDAPKDTASNWAARARGEARDAKLLSALAELSLAVDDDGPFLVQLPLALADVKHAVEQVRDQVTPDLDLSAAQRCADALEAAPCRSIHGDLFELAVPEVRRVLRLLDSESKVARRGRSFGSGARRPPRTRATCGPAAH